MIYLQITARFLALTHTLVPNSSQILTQNLTLKGSLFPWGRANRVHERFADTQFLYFFLMMLFVILPSVSHCMLKWLVHISLHVDAFQTHFPADLNVHNNVPGSNLQFVCMFPVCFVICSQYGFGKSLATLRAHKFHSRVCGEKFKSGWKLH